MNPAEKHLAMGTEDHPLGLYATFEGAKPDGRYGPGTVMVWDTGTYDPTSGILPDKQLAHGEIAIERHGIQLRGSFILIRAGRRAADSGSKQRRLFVKLRDEYADLSSEIENARLAR